MRKKVALILVFVMCLSCFAGCTSEPGESSTSSAASSTVSEAKEDSSSTASTAETGDSNGDANADKAFTKFEEPVDVHIAMGVSPTDTSLPAGDSVDNNQYTRYLKDNYNINIICDWSAAYGDDVNQKVALAIASDNLPDGLATNRMYKTTAAKMGLLYDITDLFQEYASDQVKGVMDSTDGRAYEDASYDGKQVCLVGIEVETGGVSVMNIRKDWLDELNLEVPETIAEIETVAKAFRDEKPAGDATVPIMGVGKGSSPYAFFLEANNLQFRFDPIFQALDAYPGFWLDNGDGTVSYGTNSENTKAGLEVLANWYAEGLIDPELGIRDTPLEEVNAGNVGIYFAPWWSIGYGSFDVYTNDPTTNWQAYPVYTDDGEWYTHMPSTTNSYTLISANASEDAVKAMIIMQNALLRDEATFDVSVELGWYPIRNLMAPADECEYTYHELFKVLDGEIDPNGYTSPNSSYKLLDADVHKVLEVVKDYEKGQDLTIDNFIQDDMGKFARMYSLLIGDKPYATVEPAKKVYSVTYTTTETIEKKWSNLKTMEDETVLKIITGKADIDSFDTFITDWESQGGNELIAEIEADMGK